MPKIKAAKKNMDITGPYLIKHMVDFVEYDPVRSKINKIHWVNMDRGLLLKTSSSLWLTRI